MGSAVSARLPRDVRSVHVQDVLRAKWRDHIKRLPAGKRENWLRSAEGIVALGAKPCRDLLKEIQRGRESLMDNVPGGDWFEQAFEHGAEFPPGKKEVCRRHGVRMVLSRVATSYGTGELYDPLRRPASQRWTPPQCVELEDLLDAMSPLRAEIYDFPPSPSAVTIRRVEARGGHGIRGY